MNTCPVVERDQNGPTLFGWHQDGTPEANVHEERSHRDLHSRDDNRQSSLRGPGTQLTGWPVYTSSDSRVSFTPRDVQWAAPEIVYRTGSTRSSTPTAPLRSHNNQRSEEPAPPLQQLRTRRLETIMQNLVDRRPLDEPRSYAQYPRDEDQVATEPSWTYSSNHNSLRTQPQPPASLPSAPRMAPRPLHRDDANRRSLQWSEPRSRLLADDTRGSSLGLSLSSTDPSGTSAPAARTLRFRDTAQVCERFTYLTF